MELKKIFEERSKVFPRLLFDFFFLRKTKKEVSENVPPGN